MATTFRIQTHLIVTKEQELKTLIYQMNSGHFTTVPELLHKSLTLMFEMTGSTLQIHTEQ